MDGPLPEVAKWLNLVTNLYGNWQTLVVNPITHTQHERQTLLANKIVQPL